MGQLPTKNTLLGKSPAGFVSQIAIPPIIFLKQKSALERIQAEHGVVSLYVGSMFKVFITDVPSIVMAKQLSTPVVSPPNPETPTATPSAKLHPKKRLLVDICHDRSRVQVGRDLV